MNTLRIGSALACALVVAVTMIGGTTAVGQGVFSGTEVPIVVAAGDQIDPAISGNVVVYTDYSSGDADIYYWDGAVHPAVVRPGQQELADIFGTTIVYTDRTAGKPGEIFTYDIPTATITNVSNDIDHEQTNPVISSTTIAWEDFRFGPGHIGVYDRASGLRDIAGDQTSTQSQPAVSGTNIVFVDNAAGSIRLLDAVSFTETILFAGPAFAPDIDGSHVAWTDSSGTDSDIVVRDLSTGTSTRLTLAGNQTNPKISGDFVAFEDQSTGISVALWHWTGGELLFFAPTGSSQALHDISGTRIVYRQSHHELRGKRRPRLLPTFRLESLHIRLHLWRSAASSSTASYRRSLRRPDHHPARELHRASHQRRTGHGRSGLQLAPRNAGEDLHRPDPGGLSLRRRKPHIDRPARGLRPRRHARREVVHGGSRRELFEHTARERGHRRLDACARAGRSVASAPALRRPPPLAPITSVWRPSRREHFLFGPSSTGVRPERPMVG